MIQPKFYKQDRNSYLKLGPVAQSGLERRSYKAAFGTTKKAGGQGFKSINLINAESPLGPINAPVV